MKFEDLNFDKLNETDIREEVIAPLLRYLGYRSGTSNNIIREQSLKYPKIFLGHKKPQKDPEVRGIADYICEAEEKIRWVIEAKSPSVSITPEEIEQSYSYANHPEIRAVYFCVCNGKELLVFQTNKGPGVDALLTVSYEDINDSLEVIENVLSPSAILRDFPDIEIDVGAPIGPGLRSVVRITGGQIIFTENSLGAPALNGLTISVIEGAIERKNGNLVAFLNTCSPFAQLQALNERLGLTKFEVISSDESISIIPEQPTEFKNSQTVILPAGESILDLNSWKEIELPINITCHTDTLALGYMQGQDFTGKFHCKFFYVEAEINLELVGDFKIHLA